MPPTPLPWPEVFQALKSGVIEGQENPLALTYLNRLSDLLFIASRVANGASGEVLWIPGKDREPVDERARRARERITDAR